ncbi:MAG: hypothetical protein FWD05_11645 [Oscillospiraceae bacterium]|nr:hypothetical protein [Oscillospiraceae bacterium]
MIGLYIGIGVVAGVIQYLLLQLFTGTLTKGKGKVGGRSVLYALTQFLFPFIVLVVCALLLVDSLMWVGIGMASALIICAVTRFIITAKAGKKD